MATIQNTYTGDGSTVLFSFTFPYIEPADVKASINGVDTTEYTLANATTVQFNTAPVAGTTIRIFRSTASDATSATFFPGSTIRAQDLNNNFEQTLFISQETQAAVANSDATSVLETANQALSAAQQAQTTASAAEAAAQQAVDTAISAGDNVSQLTNDANYVAVADNVSALNNDANYVSRGDDIGVFANNVGYVTDAPADNKNYGRRNGTWTEVTSGGGGTQTGVGADAWVQVSSTGVLQTSFNVSSIDKIANAEYRVNFTTPMPTASYAVTATTSGASSRVAHVKDLTTTNFVVVTSDSTGNPVDENFSAVVHATDATLPSTITMADWDEVSNREVSLKAYGAVGDGVTDDTQAILNWLQSGGSNLYAPAGTYLVAAAGADAGGVNADISESISVRCDDGAVFKAGSGLDNDIVRINCNPTGWTADRNITVKWVGGKFDMTGQKTSTSVPFSGDFTAQNGVGSSATTDGLSIRGEVNISSTYYAGFRHTTVKDVQVLASTTEHWKQSGGDSGININGSRHIHVSNNQLIGCRDLGIYCSGLTAGEIEGGSTFISDNKFYGCLYGCSVKRLSSNVQMVNNTGYDTAVVATSTAITGSGAGSNVVIANNVGNRAWRVVRAVGGAAHSIHGNVSVDHGLVDPDTGLAFSPNVFASSNSCVCVEGLRHSTVYGNHAYKTTTFSTNTVAIREASVGNANLVVSSDSVSFADHNLEVDDAVYFSGISSVTGISDDTLYYVTTVTADTFKLAADKGGSAITLSGSDETVSLYYASCHNFVYSNTADSVASVVTEEATHKCNSTTSWDNYGKGLSSVTPVVIEGDYSFDRDTPVLDFVGSYVHTGTASTTDLIEAITGSQYFIKKDSITRRDSLRLTMAGEISGTANNKFFSSILGSAFINQAASAFSGDGEFVIDLTINANSSGNLRIAGSIGVGGEQSILFGRNSDNIFTTDGRLALRVKLDDASDSVTVRSLALEYV